MRNPCRSGRLLWWALALLLTCLLAVPAALEAQAPQPLISWVFPAGAQKGKTIEATVNGKDLQGASGVHFSRAGVTGKVAQVVNPNTVRIEVTVAPDAELGELDLRLVSPGGVSNRVRFQIGELPELNEAEPNTEKTQAQKLPSLPVLVNGQVLENDRDYFRFAAKAGQTLVFEVQARALLPYLADTVPGWLDASLTLYDPGGRALSTVDFFRHRPDPVLIYQVPADGEYLVEVRDVLYRGRGDFIYRLSIGALPYLTHIFPLGGQRNTTAQVELHGANLPGPIMALPIPPDSPPLRLVGLPHGGLSGNSLPFAAGDMPEIRETEPNDASAQANRVTAPVAIDGRIQQSGDVDHFGLAAQAGQTLVIEVQARRLESPLDSVLAVLNAQGGLLAENDDMVDPEAPLVTHHADSRLVYTFPAAGDYLVRIKDIQAQGGEEYAYRLVLAPPQPDYALRIVPDYVRVAKGDSAIITVSALRKDGFGGQISLSAQDLPAGFAASEAVIPAGQDQARLTLTPLADAAVGVICPRIVGTAEINNQPVVRTAVGAEDVMQAFSYRHIVPTRQFVVAVLEPGLFGLSLGLLPKQLLQAPPGSEVQVVLKASRQAEAKFPINLAGVDLPAGITMKPATIPADKDEATVPLSIPKEAPPGMTFNVIVGGTMATGKETVTRIAPAIPIKVVAPQPQQQKKSEEPKPEANKPG
ncbi:MAG: hypothetical protein ACUVUC_04675 [Thermoguttaceae bacterium]